MNGLMHRRLLSLVILVAACLGFANNATAGGLWVPGHGVVPLGRGGTGVATTTDPNALWYNPALLTTLDDHVLTIDLALLDLAFEHTRAPTTARNGDAVNFNTVENEAFPQIVPRIMFSTDLGTDQFALGAGLYAPYAPKYRFPEDGAQRYVNIDQTTSLILYQHLAFAWRPHPRFSVGAGIQNMSAILDSTLASSSYVGLWGEPEDKDLDLLIRFHAEDLLTITGNFGFWTEPVDGLELGASVQIFSTIEDDAGEATVRLPSHYAFDAAELEGDTLALKMELPWIFRVGASYGIEDVFDVEVNVMYETWSVQDEIVTTPDDVKLTGVPTVGEIEIGPLSLARNLKDVISAHIGGDWHVVPKMLTVRAGFMFEQGSIPDETYSVFQADAQKYAPTIGASVRLGSLRLDVAYSHIFQDSKTITNSEVRQVNPTYEEGAVVVGNGEYASGYDVVGLGMAYFF